MRNMSFALTKNEFLRGEKDVTRRVQHFSKINPKQLVGWSLLKPGDHFSAVEKSQGLRKGERIRYLGQCICISNEPERLSDIIKEPVRPVGKFRKQTSRPEVAREGFPELSAAEFVQMFCKKMGCGPGSIVRRIEFRKVENGE